MNYTDQYSLLKRKPEWGKLALSHSEYVADVPLKEFSRLPNTDACLASDQVSMHWKLMSLASVKGFRMVLHLKAVIAIDCERCASKIQMAIDEYSSIAFLKYFHEDEQKVQGEDEVLDLYEVDSLWQVIEDTLLLALPASKLCGGSGCQPIVKGYGDLEEEHPFAKLESFLKKDRN